MGGGGVQIAVVDAGKISLARETQPEAEDFAEVTSIQRFHLKIKSEVAKEFCSVWSTLQFPMFP